MRVNNKNMNKSFKASNRIILKSLEVAVIQNKPIIFRDYLYANNVQCSFPNKVSFYEFFTYMLDNAYCTAIGKLHFVVETPEWENEGYTHYAFYDKRHVHSRIYLRVKEDNKTLCFDMPPF